MAIESFGAVSTSAAGVIMNCECAFERRYSVSGATLPTCCSNGNFRSIQCKAGWCFCVDLYGRQLSKEVDQLHVDDLLVLCEDDNCGEE